jgi:phospholipase/carboxylesterase
VRAREKDSRWVMLVLHGLGDSIAGYRWLPEALDLPWMNYQLINAPDHYFGGYSWYDFSGDPRPGVERSRRLLMEFMEGLEAQGVPSSEMVLFGFSQGCLMTLDVGMRYPRALGGCVGISGYAYEPQAAVRELSPVARQQRFLITHGTRDPLIPIDAVRPQIQLLKSAGLDITWREFAKEHTIAGEEELAVIRDFVRGLRQSKEKEASPGALGESPVR